MLSIILLIVGIIGILFGIIGFFSVKEGRLAALVFLIPGIILSFLGIRGLRKKETPKPKPSIKTEIVYQHVAEEESDAPDPDEELEDDQEAEDDSEDDQEDSAVRIREKKLANGEVEYYFSVPIHGMRYRDDAVQQICTNNKYRGSVELIKEPKNIYDKNAIKVCVESKLIGYIDSKKVSAVHEVWDRITSTDAVISYRKSDKRARLLYRGHVNIHFKKD